MYSKLTRHFTVTLICLLFCLFADGQTVSIVGSISKGGNGKDAVTYKGKKYGLTGSTLLYKISVGGLSEGVTVSSFSYKLNNDEEKDGSVTNGTMKDVTIDGSSTSSYGEYKMTVKVTLSTGATIEKTNNEIVICSNEWSASKGNGWTADNSKKVVWDTDQNTLSVEASKTDGNCSIGYQWLRGSTSLGEENTWKGSLGIDNVVNSDVTVKCSVSFYAPDGETVWDSKELTQVFTVYKSLAESNVDLKAYYGEDASSDKKLYLCKDTLLSGRNIKVTLKAPFGSIDASTAGIQWKINGNDYGTEKSFICNPEPYGGNIDANGSHTDKYTVSFSYKPHSSLTAKQLAYSKNVEVITYNLPKFTLRTTINSSVTVGNNDALVVWADTKIGVNCETAGGYSSSWSYSWTEGSNKKTSKNYDAKTYSVDKNKNSKSYTVTLVIENKDPNGKSMFKETRVFTIDSWRKPTNKGKELVNRHLDEKSDTASTIYLYTGYDESYGKRYFEIPDLGLDPDNWSYIWLVDNKETDNNTKTFNPVRNVQGDCSVVGKVIYKPQNLLAGLSAYSESKSLSVKFFDMPSVSIQEWKNGDAYLGRHIAVWETTLNEVNVITTGGNSWEYDWKINGEAVGSLSADKKRWSDKLSVKTGSEVSSDYVMSLSLTNKDPNGNIWFIQNAGATYTSYKKPHPYIVEEGRGNKVEKISYEDSLWSVIKVYKDNEKSVLLADSTASINKSQYKWNNEWIYDDEVANDFGTQSKPICKKDLGFHDRDTLECLVNLLCQPENMSDDVAYRETLHFITIFWPAPGYELKTGDKDFNNEGFLQYDDADVLNLSIEVSDCIDDDASGWTYIWRNKYNNALLGNTSSYIKTLQNDKDYYKDDSLYVVVSNNLGNYGKYSFSKQSDVKYRVNPIFNVVNDSVLIAKPEVYTDTVRYKYAPYYDANSKVYHSMIDCGDITFPTHYSNNKTIYFNPSDESRRWVISINGRTLPYDSFEIADDKLVIDNSVYNESGYYNMVISGWLKIKGSDEYKRFSFSQSPVIRIYDKPLITPDFDTTKVYAVWDNTIVDTEIQMEKESTGKWSIKWFKTSDPDNEVDYYVDGGSYISDLLFENKNDLLRSSDILRFTSVCYAPDNKTVWFRDTIDRKIISWKHPEQKTIHYHETLNVKEEFKNRIGAKSVINVNDRFINGRKIQMGINTDVVDDNIRWTFEWFEVKNGEEVKNEEKTKSFSFNYPELSKQDNDTVIYKLAANVDIPKTYNGKVVEVLGERVYLEHTFITIIWPAITIVDNTNYYYKNNQTNEDSLLVVQSPNNIPKPDLSTNIEWTAGMPFEKPVYKWWRNNTELSWSEDYRTDNTGLVPVDELHTIKCEVIGEDGLDWCGESIERTVRIYPVMSVRSYIKELFDDNGVENYYSLIVGDTINLTTNHNYTFGTWTYTDELIRKTSYNDVLLASHSGKDWHYVIDKNEDWAKTLSGYTQIVLRRYVKCVSDEGFDLVINNSYNSEYERSMIIWPYDCISTPTEYMYAVPSKIIIHQGLEKDITLVADHEYQYSDNRSYWNYRWYKMNGDEKQYYSAGESCKPNNAAITQSTLFVYKVEAVYQPQGASPRSFSSYFYWNEYPVPGKIEIVKDRDSLNMREGDSCLFAISDITKSGNPDGWVFKWIDNKDTIATLRGQDGLSKTITADLKKKRDEDKMSSGSSQYKVRCTNHCPGDSSIIWCDITISFKSVKIFRRPLQPTSFDIKGDGASNIYIASGPKGVTIPSGSKDEISNYYKNKIHNYQFVFGDDTFSSEPTSDRFYIYDSNPVNPWVITLWYYEDDHFYCYSDTVYLSKSRSNTRSGIGEYSIDFPHFTAEFEEPATVSVSIFDSYGALIKTIVFDKKCSYDEDVDIAGLSEGVYVVLFDINGVKKSVKVVIR